MEPLMLQLPCGTRQTITSSVILGRGNPRTVSDPQLSRQQIQITPVEGIGQVLQITNLGLNPIIVESRQPADQLQQAAAAAAAAAAAGVTWQFSDLLEQGDSTCIGPNTRFYLAARQGTTLFTVMANSGSINSSGGGGGGGGGGAGAGAQQLEEAAAAAAAAAAEAAEVEQRQSQLEADAALAAALAAEEEEEGGEEGEDDEDDEEEEEDEEEDEAAAAAAAVAAVAAAERAEAGHAADRPAKRARLANGTATPSAPPLPVAAADGDPVPGSAAAGGSPNGGHVGAAGAGAGTGAGGAGAGGDAEGGGTGVSLPVPPSAADTPTSLLAVTGLVPASFNSGCLGARLSELVSGPMAFALVSNYMIDLTWLLGHCPDLRQADQLLLIHGYHGHAAQGLSQQATQHGLLAEAPAPAPAAAPPAAGASSSSSSCRRFLLFAPHLPLQYGTHHTKAFVLGFRGGGVRVIVHTANLIYQDCNNKTQGIWWQDFPPKQAAATAAGPSSSSSSSSTNDFEAALIDYLAALKLPGTWWREVQQLLSSHDFSSARVALVPSVPGYHSGPLKLHAYGHMRLRALLSAVQLPGSFRTAPTVIQCSSLGSLDPAWLKSEFLGSLTAGKYDSNNNSVMTANNCNNTSGSSPSSGRKATAEAAGASPQKRQRQALLPGASAVVAAAAAGARQAEGVSPGVTNGVTLHIVWPAVDEVRNSREGWLAGGSIPAKLKNVEKPFLQQHWCRWGGQPVGRQSSMPHIKSYTRFLVHQPPSQQQQQQQSHSLQVSGAAAAAAETGRACGSSGSSSSSSGVELPWWLVTSHNLSKAAWGALQKKGQQLMIRSYELGVLATPALEAAYRAQPHRYYSCTPSASTSALPAAQAAAAAALARAGAAGSSSSIDSSSRAAGVLRPQAAQASDAVPSVCFYAWNQYPEQQQQQQDAVGEGATAASSSSSSTSSASRVVIPVPYLLPPVRYQPGDQPWCVDVAFPGVDMFGHPCPRPDYST